MRYLILIAILVVLYLPPKSSVTEEVDDTSDYNGVQINISHTDNVCRWTRANVADISITVNYTEPSDEIDYFGIWFPAENLIVLNIDGGLDINTVAHEVYHVVQTKMDEYEIADPHWGAYIQGGLTTCVWKLVEQDVNEAEYRSPFVE